MMEQDNLLKELEDIHDGYKLDVRQFIAFVKERRLPLACALKEYASWLDEERDGKRYSPATINRKIAAAKSRIRYAFKNSSSAEKLRAKYQLEEILKEVKLKRVGNIALPAEKVLSVEEAKKLAKGTRDATINFMVRFIVGTGVRVSEMLAVRLVDIRPSVDGFAEIRIVGKGRKERVIHAKASFVDLVRDHFRGSTYLFEHDGKPFNRISVTNRIKHESLRTIGREVTAQQLRYTWAMIQIQRGKNVQAVASILGYVDPGLAVRMFPPKTLGPQEAFLDVGETERNEVS
jgi:integrase/recombinase XerD